MEEGGWGLKLRLVLSLLRGCPAVVVVPTPPWKHDGTSLADLRAFVLCY